MPNAEPKSYADLKVGKPKQSTVTIEASIAPETLARFRAEVLAEAKQTFKAPGFREGHVPEAIVLEHIHEHHLLEEAAERAIRASYPEIIEASGIAPASTPHLTLKKLADGNPLEFSIEIGVRPAVKLPNYRKIAEKIKDGQPAAAVTDAEVDAVIEEVRSMRTGEDGVKPEVTDEFAKSVGPFENAAALKEKIRENLLEEKKEARTREVRKQIADALTAESKIEVSELSIDDEAASARREFESALAARKYALADYLKQANKTEEEFNKEEREHAERRIKTRLALQEIAKEEKIEPKAEDIEHELEHARQHFAGADEADLRMFITDMLAQDLVLALLENPAQAN